MSILETFYILFKGDSTDVKKAADDAEKSTKNLDESLKTAGKDSEKIGKSFLELARAAAAFIGVGAAAFKVFHGITEASQYAHELGNVSRALNVDAGALDAWGQAVQRNGGTAQGFQQSLRSLATHFGTSANVALKSLPRLADAFSRLGNFNAQRYGKILGLDEATILLLQRGRREVEAVINRQKELGVVTQKDIEVANKYKIANLELSLAFRGLYLSIGQTVLPVLADFYRLLVPVITYIRDHKDLVIGAFLGIGAAATIMLAPFIIASAPIIATGAAIAFVIGLFALLYEDVQAFRHGHNSLIGEILSRWPLVGTAVKKAIDGWLGQFRLLINVFKTLLSLFDKFKSYLGGNNKITLDILNGQTLLDNINNSPLNSQSPNSIFTSRAFQRNSTINTGDIAIHTQATDAAGVTKSVRNFFEDQFAQLNNFVADGVAY
jgi:hypothetical protein